MAGNYYLDKYGTPQGAVPLGPPDTLRPVQVQQGQVSIPNTQANTQRTRVQTQGDLIDNATKGATAPYTVRQAAAKTAQDEAKAAQDRQAMADAQRAAAMKQAASGLNNDEVLAAIAKARNLGDGWATGPLGAMLDSIPGTQAHDLQQQINTIAAGTTLDKLQALRDQSATGASGLGQLSNREGELLRDSVAPLGQTQSTAAFNSNLNAVEDHYRKMAAIRAGADPRFPGVKDQFGIANPITADGATQALAVGLEAAKRGGPVAVKRYYANPEIKDLARRSNTWFGAGTSGAPRKGGGGWKIERVED